MPSDELTADRKRNPTYNPNVEDGPKHAHEGGTKDDVVHVSAFDYRVDLE